MIERIKLRNYNLVMGFLHLVQGIVVVALSNNFTTPITTSFLQFDPNTQTLNTATSTLFEFNLGYGVAAFLFLSSLFHLIIATFYYKKYIADLALGVNKLRWIEYSLSASLMIVLIGTLSGIYDLSSLIMMFGLTAIMNLTGLLMETHNQIKSNNKVNWLSFWIGSLAGIIPWIVLVIYFIGAENQPNTDIPTFVYWIYGSIFAFFNVFAINMYLQYKKIGPWKNYIYGEFVYILLSLTAKSLLAWQIFAGTLRPM